MSNTPLNSTTSSGVKKGPLPLEGITVVSLEHAIAAPFCTRQLADMGARVIKIERPGVGDAARRALGADDHQPVVRSTGAAAVRARTAC